MENFEAGALGSKPVFQVLIVTDAAGAALRAAQPIRQTLDANGHVTQVLSMASGEVALPHTVPEILLLDVGSQLDTAQEFCRQLKQWPGAEHLPLVAVLTPHPKTRQVSQSDWEASRVAGADDFLSSDVTVVELEARLNLLARLARLNRDLAATRDQLSRSLQYDELTQLLNRRAFFRAAHREWAHARRYHHPLACLMLDIDHFRAYNATFGFACGDYVLRTVANIIRQWARESDILARFGEEKFVIMLPETDVQGAVMMQEKLQKVLTEMELTWQRHAMSVAISVGVSEKRAQPSPQPGAHDDPHAPVDEAGESLSVREELAELLADADAALTVAKKGARLPTFSMDTTPHVLGRIEENVTD